MDFFEVANLDELRDNKRKLVTLDKNQIVLFYLNGKVYAMNSICPHSSGDLSQGELDDQEVICPGHQYMFNIKTGVCLNHPGYSLRTYKVKIDGEKVLVGI